MAISISPLFLSLLVKVDIVYVCGLVIPVVKLGGSVLVSIWRNHVLVATIVKKGLKTGLLFVIIVYLRLVHIYLVVIEMEYLSCKMSLPLARFEHIFVRGLDFLHFTNITFWGT